MEAMHYLGRRCRGTHAHCALLSHSYRTHAARATAAHQSMPGGCSGISVIPHPLEGRPGTGRGHLSSQNSGSVAWLRACAHRAVMAALFNGVARMWSTTRRAAPPLLVYVFVASCTPSSAKTDSDAAARADAVTNKLWRRFL